MTVDVYNYKNLLLIVGLIRQSSVVYNKDKSRPRFEGDKRIDVDSQRKEQYIREIGEIGRKMFEIKRSSNAVISNLHQVREYRVRREVRKRESGNKREIS